MIVIGRGDEEYVAHLAGELLTTHVRAGDDVLFDGRAGVATELLPKEEVEELVLEEIPDVSYEDIGGLEGQIDSIRDAWAASGWEAGPLGYPISDEYAVADGRRSDFQRGSITWIAATDQTSLLTNQD